MLICISILFAIAATQARDVGPIPNAPAYSNLRNCHDLSQSRLEHRRAFSAPYRWSLRASFFQLVMEESNAIRCTVFKRFDEKFKYDDGSKISVDTGIVSSAEENEEVIFQCRGERMIKIGVPKLYRYSWLSYEQHENHTEVR